MHFTIFKSDDDVRWSIWISWVGKTMHGIKYLLSRSSGTSIYCKTSLTVLTAFLAEHLPGYYKSRCWIIENIAINHGDLFSWSIICHKVYHFHLPTSFETQCYRQYFSLFIADTCCSTLLRRISMPAITSLDIDDGELTAEIVTGVSFTMSADQVTVRNCNCWNGHNRSFRSCHFCFSLFKSSYLICELINFIL